MLSTPSSVIRTSYLIVDPNRRCGKISIEVSLPVFLGSIIPLSHTELFEVGQKGTVVEIKLSLGTQKHEQILGKQELGDFCQATLNQI